jgi:N-acetylneuraminic acid mutarotase
MPGQHIGAGSGVIGDKLYVLGGSGNPGTYESSVYKMYNPATDSWYGPFYMLTARSFLAASTANGVLYALGGELFENVLATNERYTP